MWEINFSQFYERLSQDSFLDQVCSDLNRLTGNIFGFFVGTSEEGKSIRVTFDVSSVRSIRGDYRVLFVSSDCFEDNPVLSWCGSVGFGRWDPIYSDHELVRDFHSMSKSEFSFRLALKILADNGIRPNSLSLLLDRDCE